MAKRDNEKEKKEDLGIPKLNAYHFKEITGLVKMYGGTIKVLAYWRAVTLHEDGSIKAVLDHSEHDSFTMDKYEALEPLKGIKYIGNGFSTYQPYTWCTEWLRQWEWWCTQNAHLPEVKPLLAKHNSIKTMREFNLKTGVLA